MTDAPETPNSSRPSPLFGRWVAPAALGAASVALVLAALPYAQGQGDFGGKVRAYLLKNPQVLDEMVAAREQAEAQGHVERVNAAAAANPALLRIAASDVAFGPADAKVTVIEYFDFRCPGCKAVTPDFIRLMQANPDVRFVFRDWPILDRGNEAASAYAARAAVAAHRQGKYLPVYQALMAERALNPERVDAVLIANGVDLARAKADMGSSDTARHLADVDTSGRVLQLQGTPTFFINGRTTASIEPAEVAQAIRAAKG